MAAKFDASQTVPSETISETTEESKRPDWLPEKFMKDGAPDYEALAKSYAELEKGKSKPATAAEVDPAVAATASVEDAKGALDSVGLNYDEISARFQQTGSLADADRAALNKAGVPDAMIDTYIKGQETIGQNLLNTVFDSVGGQDKYVEMMGWAKANLTQAEKNAYDKAVDSGDIETVKLAVAGLKSRQVSAEGKDPTLVSGTNTPSVGSTYRSNEELRVAMSDPRYRRDPAYRSEVIAKLNRSSIL